MVDHGRRICVVVVSGGLVVVVVVVKDGFIKSLDVW